MWLTPWDLFVLPVMIWGAVRLARVATGRRSPVLRLTAFVGSNVLLLGAAALFWALVIPPIGMFWFLR